MRPLLILLLCSGLAAGARAVVAWDAMADVKDFRVWRGIELLATVETNEAGVELPADLPSTLTVTARDSLGRESPHSEPMTVMPVTPEHSPDLATWQSETVFFFRVSDRYFFRFRSPFFSLPADGPPR